MAATLTATPLHKPQSIGELLLVSLSCNFDGEYDAGGETLTVNRAREILSVAFASHSGFVPVWVPATKKVMLYTGDNDAVADGALVEVTAAVDVDSADFTAIVIYR